ncbi:MAG: helix-turn-helix domain-containing protein [Geminicoccaceae bacterium]
MKLAQYLDKYGLTESAFADEVGCAQQSVNRYKREHRIPPRKVMERIIKATNGQVAPADFYAFDDFNEPQSARSHNGRTA